MGTVITWEILAYFMALIGVKEFSDLGALTSDQLKLSDPKLLKTEDWNISMSKQPVENTGGVDVGLNVNSLEYDSDTDTYKATKTGSIFAVSAPSAVKAILNALGVNVMSTPEVNEKIANALNRAFDIGVTSTTMAAYNVPVIIKNGITYMSDSLIKLLSDALYDEGVFTFDTTIEWDVPDVSGTSKPSQVAPLNLNTFLALYALSTLDINRSNESVMTNLYNDFITRISSYGWSINDPWGVIIYQRGGYDNNVLILFTHYDINTSYTYYKLDNAVYTSSTLPGLVYVANTSSFTFNNYQQISDWRSFIGSIYRLDATNVYRATGSNIKATVIEGGIDGIEKQSEATVPQTNNIDIDTKYPNWVTHAIDIGWYDNIVDTIRRGRALPIDVSGIRDNLGAWDETQPWAQTGATDIADTAVTDVIAIGATDVIPLVVDIDDVVVTPADIPDVIPQPTPPVVIPGGTSSAGLATIYNPTEAQVNALKGDLWSQNIITALQNIFLNNPMEAIISLNKVFCTPHTNGTATIKLGYVQTSVTGVKTVDDQYTTIDCGTVNVPEIYGNATDYEPYTNASVFLPFIGIQSLSAKDVVGGKLQIIYRVDVTTGACIAQLFVTKQGAKQMLYSFEGNCAVEIPLTGADFSRLVSATASVIAGGVANSALAVVHGVASTIGGANIQRSGNFSGNAGAMNNKKPYLIINRVLPYEAIGYNQIYGYPSNNRVQLNSVTGYTRVKEVHVEGINCTDYEKNMIEEQLKAGILL